MNKPRDAFRKTPAGSEQGFVLPYVLLVIAILAITSAIVADRIFETSKLMQRLGTSSDVEIAFMSAESQAQLVLLTGAAVDGAMELDKDAQTIALETLLGEQNVEDRPENLWHANGEMRIAKTSKGDVYVSLRDVTGLVSLNGSPANEIVPILTRLGVDKGKAIKLTAALEDYRDSDNNRRFQGAERADYRIRGLRAPANAPLRDYAELSYVLGWPEALASIDMLDLKQITTLSETTGYLNLNFASPEIKILLQEVKEKAAENLTGDIFSVLGAENRVPSKRLRLTFTYVSTQDMVWQRVIEFERRFTNPLKPFRRFWIFDRSIDTQFIRPDELKYVINAPSDSL